jgi:hypothetical protein
VKVGRLGFNGAAKEIVDTEGHGFTCLCEKKSLIERTTVSRGGQARWKEVTPLSNGRFRRKETRALLIRGAIRVCLWVTALSRHLSQVKSIRLYRMRKNSKSVIPMARFTRGICFFLGIGQKADPSLRSG